MNPKTLDSLNGSGAPGGGSTDKLLNPQIVAKMNKLAAQHIAPSGRPTETVEFLRARNRVIREQKHVPPREEKK